MSRKTREIKKNFKVFCEGDTECHYIDEMRRRLKLSIALKPVNMKGGGSYPSHKEVKGTNGNFLTNYGIAICSYAVFSSFERFCFKRSWNISSYSSADGALIMPTPL